MEMSGSGDCPGGSGDCPAILHIEGMHVVFTPERTHDAAGNRVKQFLQGVKCEELPENKVEKEDSGD